MALSTEDLLRLTISALMSRTGERQGDLAAAIGQAQTQVSRKQSGRQHWTLDDVDRLAAHYGLTVLDLLAGPTHAVTAFASSHPTTTQAPLPHPTPPATPTPKRTPAPRNSEPPSGPCVLCGEPATDAVEGMWQHLTSEECAEAATITPDHDQTEELTPTPPGIPVHETEQPDTGADIEHPATHRQPATPEPTPATPQPTPANTAPAPQPAAAPDRRAPGYAADTLVGQITARVHAALEATQGDTEEAQARLIKSAIPDVMALFERSRVGGRYAHSKFPPTEDVLRKKSQKGADEIWEGRPKWRNPDVYAAAKKGETFKVARLDMNAAYLSAFKCWLPVGKLIEDHSGVFDPKKSGAYQITPADWTPPHLPNPLGSRMEPGPMWVPDSLLRLLLDCHKWGLADAPIIHKALLSGATENLLEKLRRALAEARINAINEEDNITTEYVKSMYSKFASTIGESASNTEIRRPDWMHNIRSKAFTNLWRKAYKAHEAGLTVVELSGTDELHAIGDWRKVFPEGRDLNQVKLKDSDQDTYTLGGNR